MDTTEVYGATEEHGYSEQVIGEWLASRSGVREPILLTTKGLIPGYRKPLRPGGASIGTDRARLKTSYLGLWMFHRDDSSQGVGPLMDALDAEIRQTRIPTWGASNWITERLQQAIGYCRRTGRYSPAARSRSRPGPRLVSV